MSVRRLLGLASLVVFLLIGAGLGLPMHSAAQTPGPVATPTITPQLTASSLTPTFSPSATPSQTATPTTSATPTPSRTAQPTTPTAVVTAQVPPLIPREVLFGNPKYARLRISPDGTRIAYLAP